ncbi:hypothetical protein [Citrobacter freundii]|uniref:hypothetical protein n=1 Tax=Citrobacter freundii TaxID=546 RepID=UPI0023AECBD6|nr:hypothetical protein [Citrobacter freundii]
MIDKYRLEDMRRESGEKGELARWVIQLQADLDREIRKSASERAMLSRLAVIMHGSETDLNLLTVTAQSLMERCKAGNSPVTPDGWQLVPKEPTQAMNKAGWDAMNEHDAINPTYRAMLAAAPQQEVKS